MSYAPVGKYLVTVSVGGFFYFILDNYFLSDFLDVIPPPNTITYQLGRLIWTYAPLLILIVPGIWLLMKMQKENYTQV